MKKIFIVFMLALVSQVVSAGYNYPMTGTQASNVLIYGQKTGPWLGQSTLPRPFKGIGTYTYVKDVGGTSTQWITAMKAASKRFNTQDIPAWQRWINLGPQPTDIYNTAIMEGRYSTPLPLYTEAVKDQMNGHVIQCYPGFLLQNKKEARIFAENMGGKLLDFHDFGFEAELYRKIVAPTVEAYAYGQGGQTYALNLYKVPYDKHSIYAGDSVIAQYHPDTIDDVKPLNLGMFPWAFTDNATNKYTYGYYVVPNRGGVAYDGKRIKYPTWVPFGERFYDSDINFPSLASNLIPNPIPGMFNWVNVLSESDSAPITQSACVDYRSWQ